MFNERKAAQMAAWFLAKQRGRMAHLKLMKLLYLADRESLAKYSFPITGDQVVAMPHGPVLSLTLNLVNGDVESGEGGWDSWVSDRDNHEVALNRTDATPTDFDELSGADIEILESVWKQFGHMTKWQIRDYTHKHCPEWIDPEGSSRPIPFQRILEALGRSPAEAAKLAARIEQERKVHKVFASL